MAAVASRPSRRSAAVFAALLAATLLAGRGERLAVVSAPHGGGLSAKERSASQESSTRALRPQPSLFQRGRGVGGGRTRRHWWVATSMGALLAGTGATGQTGEEKTGILTQFFQLGSQHPFDQNRDGRISRDEFDRATAGGLGHHPVDEKYHGGLKLMYSRLFEAADIDGDGYLTLGEADYMQHLALFRAHLIQEWETEQEYAEVFHQIKVGEDATVTPPHFHPDLHPDEWGLEMAEKLIPHFDTSGDSVVDMAEFRQAMREGSYEWGWHPYFDDPEVVEWMDSLFKKSDVNGDGVLGIRELHYSAFIMDEAIGNGKFLERTLATEIFSDLDTNGDEVLDKAEVDAALEKFGVKRGATQVPVFLLRLFKLFPKHDENGDGVLDRREGAKLAAEMIKMGADDVA